MHSYVKSKVEGKQDKPYIVYFKDESDIKAFKHEIQAIAFVNYLNGGTQDISLIKELIEQE